MHPAVRVGYRTVAPVAASCLLNPARLTSVDLLLNTTLRRPAVLAGLSPAAPILDCHRDRSGPDAVGPFSRSLYGSLTLTTAKLQSP